MWGKPPWFISDNVTVSVRNLDAARDWYRDKLGLREANVRREDDSGLPFADLQLSKGDALLTLLEAEPGRSMTDTRPVLFTKTLEKAQDWFNQRGVSTTPVTADSGGNRLFEFIDLDGNKIEVCVEP